MTFKNFSLENHPRCNFDYVDILNGRMVSSPSIGKKCGASVPQPFTSQTNGIRIIFKTDYSVAANGFRIQYKFVTDGLYWHHEYCTQKHFWFCTFSKEFSFTWNPNTTTLWDKVHTYMYKYIHVIFYFKIIFCSKIIHDRDISYI